MKRIILISTILILMAVPAFAALVDNGDGTITDTDRNLMWYDFTYYASDWNDANNWAESLYVAGFDDWRDSGLLSRTRRQELERIEHGALRLCDAQQSACRALRNRRRIGA